MNVILYYKFKGKNSVICFVEQNTKNKWFICMNN